MPLERQLLTDAELWWQADFLPAPVAQHWYALLQQQVNWQQLPIRMFGRVLLQPRLLCWYGDASYTYSKLTLPATPWPAWLLPLKQQVEQAVGASFNGVLLNYYRDGQDSMGWHSDDEPELGRDPLIVSVSLGATAFYAETQTAAVEARIIVNRGQFVGDGRAHAASLAACVTENGARSGRADQPDVSSNYCYAIALCQCLTHFIDDTLPVAQYRLPE